MSMTTKVKSRWRKRKLMRHKLQSTVQTQQKQQQTNKLRLQTRKCSKICKKHRGFCAKPGKIVQSNKAFALALNHQVRCALLSSAVTHMYYIGTAARMLTTLWSFQTGGVLPSLR